MEFRRKLTDLLAIHIFVMIVSVDCRINRRHQVQKRFLDTCSNTAETQLHEAFSKLINRRDEQWFSMFHPEGQVFAPETDLSDGKILSKKTRDCQGETKSAEWFPDQPIADKSICPYRHVLNYNATRIPAAITEVECSCQTVRVQGIEVKCEPMKYLMRVMTFKIGCQDFVEEVQSVALACVPVYTNQVFGGTINMNMAKEPEIND